MVQPVGQRRKVPMVAFGALAIGLGVFGGVAYACTDGAADSITYATPLSGTNNTSLTVDTWANGNGDITANEPGFYFRYKAPASPAIVITRPRSALR